MALSVTCVQVLRAKLVCVAVGPKVVVRLTLVWLFCMDFVSSWNLVMLSSAMVGIKHVTSLSEEDTAAWKELPAGADCTVRLVKDWLSRLCLLVW